ncbi:MAG: hypothetical protein ACHQET_07410, partial [Chitinophagales bacterium]
MELSTIVGSIGVSLLLVAFMLSLFKFISQDHKAYLFLNLLGAGLAAYASFLIHFIPFVVLECTWGLVAL